MLGFSALTEAHPDPDVWDFDSEYISSSTSESARQLGRFQVVLDNIEDDTDNAYAPSHLTGPVQRCPIR
jgi:hypothetical protein